ncbi:MAG TPA: HAD-IIIA family hydrolase [Acidobacteriota bacterium]|nr:HAD-IIIA family hydrolase [Acidobacteriota bacterium]
MANRAVFLDRDGTIIEEVNYLSRIDQIEVYPFSPLALRRLREAGFLIVVISNQSAVARGYLDENELDLIHQEISNRLRKQGAWIDAFYYCPHYVDAAVEKYRLACHCRKPAPGMILRAASDLHIDLPSSFVVGDRASDIGAARSAGCRSVLVKTGYGNNAIPQLGELQPDYVAADLLEAAEWIISTDSGAE